ncbi:MAG TPA: ABC transporter ATP-binding protein [Polyangia bacterium]|jgi:ABC-2 type transport system ATP-binding protein|nr:ABC transporter ATP-binding protein [Polyangia bacterium]
MSRRRAASAAGPSPERQGASPVIVAEGVSCWYGPVMAVNELSVTIGPGITGLLGPNGAGKSTFMKLLVGQLRPARGRLTLFGETVWGHPALLGRVGYAPEHESNYDEITGLEFVAALTELQGFSPEEAGERARAAIARVDLTAAQDRRIGEYSKGMRQRIKLAQAMAHEPAVLILDEPLSGCDPLAKNRILGLIRELGAAGTTVLVSSHVLHEIEAMTSEILMMDKGRILAEGNIYEIRDLIDRHPHRIRVVCDRPRALAAALVREEAVTSVQVEAEALVLETRRPDECYPLVPRVARAEGVHIRALTSPDNNLQAVFRYLTEERARRAQGAS